MVRLVCDKVVDLMSGEKIGDGFGEIYWDPSTDDEVGEHLGVVVARGREAVSTMREMMMMLRESHHGVERGVSIVSEGQLRPGAIADNPDARSSDLSYERNVDLDILISTLSDMARTYDDSPSEHKAIRLFNATCAMQEDSITRLLMSLLRLMGSSDHVDVTSIASVVLGDRASAKMLHELVERRV